jgi:Carboxypeptidase regulatory-like domain/TonB dependent receptor
MSVFRAVQVAPRGFLMCKVPALLALLSLPLYPCALRAQTTNASITGRVTDPSKAVIADAKVAAVSLGTNFRNEAATNGAGEYALANLPPGTYRIEVEKSGFKKLIQPDVTLHVQDALAIDFEMTVGSISDSITVQAGAPLVNTTSATVSTVVDQNFVENIPLNGRSFQTLIMLTPGVVVTQTAYDDQGQFSVNGQRADGNYFTVDGVSANFGVTGYPPMAQAAGGALPALTALGGTNSLVSVDAMQEFRVQTSSFAPEFGRTPGGQISILTRSGSNQFHGTAFEYFRNSVLDANDWFSNFHHLPKPEERQNDFGGIFGGPILKDKTFFFFSYEGLRLRQPATQETVVPDMASRQAAPSTMQPYLNAYPIPNGSELGDGMAQFNGSYSNPSSLDAYSIRVDHAINSKLTLFGRYNNSPSQTSVRGPYLDLSTTELLSTSVQTVTLGLTASITPSIGNELRANYSNDRVGSQFQLDNFGGAVPVPDSVLFPSGFSSAKDLFEFYLGGGAGEWTKGKFAIDEQRQINVVDNVSWAKRGHALKFGVDYRWLSPFSSQSSYLQFVQFNGLTGPGGALSGAAVFADVAALQTATLLEHNFSFYGQDTWKLTPRLTVTYGLRWDINPPLEGKNFENQPFAVTGANQPSTLALAPRGTPMYDTTYGNFAPRVGLAYRLRDAPTGATVLRGGFGIFYDLGYGSLGGLSGYFPFTAPKIIPPSSCASGSSGVCFPLSPQEAEPPAFSTSPPVTNIVAADPHLKVPRTYEWNVALDQSLGSSQSVSLTYVGAIGRDLLRTTDWFSPNPDFYLVEFIDNTATSDYHALQVKFQRRLLQGLQALASYTFSHSIDTASTDAFGNLLYTPTFVASPNVDRGDSDFDIRHSFTAGLTYAFPKPGWNGFAKATLGGWSIDAFILARSAPPADITSGLVIAGGSAIYPRPNVVPGVPLVLYGSKYPGGKIFNAAAFTPAQSGVQGDFGRNVLRGFGATQADVAFQRQFHLREQLNLRFRAEFFNIFNHPNFGPPTNSLTSPLFGYSTQTLASSLGSGGANGGFNPLYQVGGPRSIQLALKLAF